MMRSSLRARLGSECGAILIQVAVALLVFTTLSAFVIDYGIQLVSHNQIQSTVDAAALAGATALAYDSYSDRSAGGPAQSTAQAVAAENRVWADHASVQVDPNVVCSSTYDAGPSAKPIRACVQVTAFRNEDHGNAIPSYVANLMGVSSFGVQATAIAETKDANATDCLKPLAIPDRWVEYYPAPPVLWPAALNFDRWDPKKPANLLPVLQQDTYTSPDQLGAGTGVTITDQFGAPVTLKAGSIVVGTNAIANIKPWLYLPVQIPGSQWGPNAVRANTNSCAASKVAIGASLNFVPGGVPTNAGLIAQGLVDLVNRDPGAYWDAVTQRVKGSCADLLIGRCGSMSPRIIAVATYDPLDFAIASHGAGATRVLVTNIAGFFIDSVAGTDVTGHITRHPGLRDPGVMTLFDASSFLRASMLVQ